MLNSVFCPVVQDLGPARDLSEKTGSTVAANRRPAVAKFRNRGAAPRSQAVFAVIAVFFTG